LAVVGALELGVSSGMTLEVVEIPLAEEGGILGKAKLKTNIMYVFK
jgi:hypothetical protein